MTHFRNNISYPINTSIVLLAASILWPIQAKAAYLPTDDSYINAQLATVFDSNVFRTASLNDVASVYHPTTLADRIDIVSIGGQYLKQLNQQSFTLDGNYNQNSYARYSGLNYKSWNTSGEYDWKVGSQWQGDFIYNDKKEEPSLDVSNTIARDVVRTRVGSFDAQYTPISYLFLVSGLQTTSVRRQVENSLDYDQTMAQMGAFFRTDKGSKLGILVQHSNVQYPYYGSLYQYSQTNSQLQGDWPVSSKLDFSVAYGVNKVTYQEQFQPSYSSNIFNLTANWQPTARSSFSIGYNDVPGDPGLSTSEVLNKSIYFQWTDVLTDKLKMKALLRRNQLQYFDENVRVDNNTYRLDLIWSPLRMLELSMYGQLVKRVSGFADDTYNDNQIGLSAKYSF